MAGYRITGLSQPATLIGTRNPNAFIEAYLDLQKKLSALYGKSEKEDTVEKIGNIASSLLIMSIQNDAPYETEWEYKNTTIHLKLYYEKEIWNLHIFYMSPLFMNILKELKEKRDKEKQSNTDGL